MTDDEKNVLADIQRTLTQLVTNQALHSQEQEEIKATVQKLAHVLLEGNGTPAMTVRVAVIENELRRVKEDRDDKKMPRSVWTSIVVSILLGVVSLVYAAGR
ncbi:MAG TPA: hypothetical protein VFT74_18770 [Isosphaeraceae bacterium]|nr:hypothetical protein [Isosphaeraceae bacterium]